jgi:hypothetical protein
MMSSLQGENLFYPIPAVDLQKTSLLITCVWARSRVSWFIRSLCGVWDVREGVSLGSSRLCHPVVVPHCRLGLRWCGIGGVSQCARPLGYLMSGNHQSRNQSRMMDQKCRRRPMAAVDTFDPVGLSAVGSVTPSPMVAVGLG